MEEIKEILDMILPSFKEEERLLKKGYKSICGIDEVGIGALAGPIVCGGVVIKQKVKIKDVRDSKLLLEKKRGKVFEEIRKTLPYMLGIVYEKEIDKLGMAKAKILALERLLMQAEESVDYLLLDGKFQKSFGIPSTYIIKGDQKCFSIAAASIVAKVTRDRMLRVLDKELPEYKFKKHKGYGTKEHLAAITKFGPSKYHRKSYAPVKAALAL